MVKKIGIVFSGFGSQYVGMAKDVYDESRAVQEYFEEAYNCLGINFVKLCFASSDEELSKIIHANLAIFLTDVSLYSLLGELGLVPELIAGYGIGRYAALFAAGGLSFPDALYLVNKYSIYYQEFVNKHKNLKMVQVDGLSLRKLKTLCDQSAGKPGTGPFISAINSDNSQVIVGTVAGLKKIEKALSDLDISLKPSDLGGGLYCELAQQMVDDFKIYLTKVDFKDLKTPVASSLTGKVITTGEQVVAEIIEQETEPVLWYKVAQCFSDLDVIIEVGSGQLLASALQDLYPEKLILKLNNKIDLLQIKTLLVPEVVKQNKFSLGDNNDGDYAE